MKIFGHGLRLWHVCAVGLVLNLLFAGEIWQNQEALRSSMRGYGLTSAVSMFRIAKYLEFVSVAALLFLLIWDLTVPDTERSVLLRCVSVRTLLAGIAMSSLSIETVLVVYGQSIAKQMSEFVPPTVMPLVLVDVALVIALTLVNYSRIMNDPPAEPSKVHAKVRTSA